MTRTEILEKIEVFTAEQLFNFISQGIVKLDEIKNTGELDASKRHAIIALQNQRTLEEDELWKKNHHSKEGCLKYIDLYPNGKHTNSAKDLLENYIWLEYSNNLDGCKRYLIEFPRGKYANEARQKIKEAEDILEAINKNPNSKPPSSIRDYLKRGIIQIEDLRSIGIPSEIIDKVINSYNSQNYTGLGEAPNSIPDGFTEVYFWGIRGSGKTTALASVLSTANKLGFIEFSAGPGFNYMLQLQETFSNPIAVLPSGTPDQTQYLPFTLKKPNEKYYRSISLIELSGEIFQGFLYKNANKKFDSDEKEKTFNKLISFLQSDNRKIHFFFVDYEKENNPDQNNYTQANYLNSAAIFFNNPKYDFFRKSTDAIYVVVTKSDLMDKNSQSRSQQIKEYLKGKSYVAFINSLRNKCVDNSINNGKVLGISFSLGKVYFTEICEFNDETAINIIDILMRRIKPQSKNILDEFINR